MPQLLVANGTHQYHDFQYRVPEYEKVFSTLIRPGSQVRLPSDSNPLDFNDYQIHAVVEQLQRYGAVPESDVQSLSSPHGLVFSIRRPVTSDKIDEARERDEAIRQGIADEQILNAGQAVGAIASMEGQGESTLEVRQLETNAGNADPGNAMTAKGGVDIKVTVSPKAGEKTVTRS